MKKKSKKKVNKELQKLLDLIRDDNINIIDFSEVEYDYKTATENHLEDKVVKYTGRIDISINLSLFKEFTNKKKKEKIKK